MSIYGGEESYSRHCVLEYEMGIFRRRPPKHHDTVPIIHFPFTHLITLLVVACGSVSCNPYSLDVQMLYQRLADDDRRISECSCRNEDMHEM